MRLLGEPLPPFPTREPIIKKENPWNLKISYVIGTLYTGHAYIDLQSPVNLIYRAYYNKTKEKQFHAKRNPFEPSKYCNFVGRERNIHVFVGNFIYFTSFMILEELEDVIDEGLGDVS